MIKAMLLAGCGGFVGTCGRYLVGKWCAGMWHGSFPMGTFLVNIIGCFIIGLFFGLLEKAHVMTPGENVLLITGFCGGFTTFSSFADDMWVLGSKGDWTTFIYPLPRSERNPRRAPGMGRPRSHPLIGVTTLFFHTLCRDCRQRVFHQYE